MFPDLRTVGACWGGELSPAQPPVKASSQSLWARGWFTYRDVAGINIVRARVIIHIGQLHSRGVICKEIY